MFRSLSNSDLEALTKFSTEVNINLPHKLKGTKVHFEHSYENPLAFTLFFNASSSNSHRISPSSSTSGSDIVVYHRRNLLLSAKTVVPHE